MALCERLLGPAGFQIVDVDCRIGGRSLIRIYLEKEQGTTLDVCAEASRTLSTALESDENFPGAFDLEVSSPGLERRLRLQSDFEKVAGREVKLKLAEKMDGLGANVTGTLLRTEGPETVLSVNGKEWRIPLRRIKQANVVWRFE